MPYFLVLIKTLLHVFSRKTMLYLEPLMSITIVKKMCFMLLYSIFQALGFRWCQDFFRFRIQHSRLNTDAVYWKLILLDSWGKTKSTKTANSMSPKWLGIFVFLGKLQNQNQKPNKPQL